MTSYTNLKKESECFMWYPQILKYLLKETKNAEKSTKGKYTYQSREREYKAHQETLWEEIEELTR